jgi:hypothetical protein
MLSPPPRELLLQEAHPGLDEPISRYNSANSTQMESRLRLVNLEAMALWRRLRLRFAAIHGMYPHTNAAMAHDRANSYVVQAFSTLGRMKIMATSPRSASI